MNNKVELTKEMKEWIKVIETLGNCEVDVVIGKPDLGLCARYPVQQDFYIDEHEQDNPVIGISKDDQRTY
jgi:hypothetical protein